MSENKRIHFIDEVRGFCVMCMVFYHAMFTMGYMFGCSSAKSMFGFFSFISPAFAFAFVMMCGISCTLSKSNLKRSVPIILAAVAVTAVSLFITPDAPIIFGILHLLGACVLIYSLTEKLFLKLNPVVFLIISLILFFLTYNTMNGYLGFKGLFTIELPDELFDCGYLMALGFPDPYEFYSDYFPLLPWFFAFTAGTFTGRIMKGRYPAFMYKKHIGFLSLLGTNTFLVYVIHQPIIYGVSYILTLI